MSLETCPCSNALATIAHCVWRGVFFKAWRGRTLPKCAPAVKCSKALQMGGSEVRLGCCQAGPSDVAANRTE